MKKQNILWIFPVITIFALAVLTGCEKEDPIEVPTITTLSVTEITSNSAKSGGDITSDGGGGVIIRGVVWSTAQHPTIDDNLGQTIDGSGAGQFTSEITGLQTNTGHYVRAYATNSVGTSYGEQVEFSTQAFDDVYNPATGKTWMDRNLGASRAATSSTDAEAYGDLYQWGRAADGHQKRASGITSTLSSSDTPGHGNFILAPNSPWDWRSPQNSTLWQGVNGVNNPCPPGYRLPTDTEWEAERQSWDSNDSAGAYGSTLKLPVAGYRFSSDGSLRYVGSRGGYWSSTVDGTLSRSLYFDFNNASMGSGSRAFGLSVRCIKD